VTISTSTLVDDTDLVRVFVAATPAEWLPMKVLEFSIKEQTELPVQLSAIYTYSRNIPTPRHLENRARTPFSFQRFLIPELCNYQGKAIYMDADMQVFRDIGELWNTPFSGNDLQTVGNALGERRPQFSVILMDCSQLLWKIEDIVAQLDSGALDYQTLMFEMKVAKSVSYSLPPAWNSLEYYDPATTCLLHYTDMNTQPWISLSNPNGALWVACLRRALDNGFISRAELHREVTHGHVRPSLISQVSSDALDAWKPTVTDIWQDMRFTPPFYSITAHRAGKIRTWISKFSRLKLLLGQALLKTR
jgi:hypothetical protein